MIKSQKGNALITLLFFMAISLAIITGVVVVVLNNATSTSSVDQGTTAYYIAETGAENALLRLIRDPSYAGETMNVDGGSVVIVVNSGTITSTATFSNTIRKVQIQTSNTNNQLNITSWKEIN